MQFLGIGLEEILLIVALIVIVVGPRRLPEMAYYLGRGLKKLQRYARLVRDEFSEEFAYLNEEMEAVRADVQEMRTTVRDVQDELTEVRGEVEEVTSEAAEELGVVRTSIEEAATTKTEAAEPAIAGAPAQEEKPVPATAGANGAAADADVNGADPPRGTPGPSYMPAIGTLDSRETPAAPATEAEAEDEAEAQPEKPLVF
ncbi:MAG: twin-arginine translocase TatA/TatE family subunit [Dehalococcoidia bacterium]|nr:twin-arginine translocase TatA/TatE family subunit [Dehalococcoidia bacterium]MYD27805.1 twin-arginine translocase TatA/TatE family subunit [Dehalococcoidia bacterium]